MPLLGGFCRTSQDLIELQLDSLKSRDVRRNSPKSCKKKSKKQLCEIGKFTKLFPLRASRRGRLEAGGEETSGYQEADFIHFGRTWEPMLVPKSSQNPSQSDPKASKIECGRPCRLQMRSGDAPGLPWGDSEGVPGLILEGFWGPKSIKHR